MKPFCTHSSIRKFASVDGFKDFESANPFPTISLKKNVERFSGRRAQANHVAFV